MIQNAIQAAIALLKKSAQDLADGVSIGGVPQWESEPATQEAHDHELAVVNGLKSALDYITGLNAEVVDLRKINEVAHARSLQQAQIIATLANQKAELESQLAAEVARLDFVLKEAAFVTEFSTESREPNGGFQLCAPGDEFGIMDLSGDGVMHPTPRAAIDAAIELAKGGA